MEGGTAALIAKREELLGNSTKIYLCDTFAGVVKATVKDKTYTGGEHRDTSIEIVEDLLFDKLSLSRDNVVLLKGIFPEETENLVTDTTFKFCHIDVDVYKSARDILNWIWGKLQIGGVVVFDDYGFSVCNGIQELVEEVKHREDMMVIHNLNGHAIFIKLL